MAVSDDEFIKVYNEANTREDAARILGYSRVDGLDRRAKSIKEKHGQDVLKDLLYKVLHDPNAHDYVDGPVSDPYFIDGVSQYDKERRRWIKSRLSRAAYIERLRIAADEFYKTLPKITPPKPPKQKYNKELIPWINIGDGHIGMLAHEAETGENFDLKIAVSELLTSIYMLIDEAPTCERGVIYDCGDMTHYENFKGLTEASGHVLDRDGRFPKMISAYIPMMRQIIDLALKKFKIVDVVINQGNHSRTNDIWMAEFLRNVYTSRVNVLNNHSVFIPYRMTDTFVLCHHGDQTKPDKLTNVMATDYPRHWGESKHRMIWTGHVHHNSRKEYPGVVIESFNNLSPSDKHAHDNGYRSRQAITMVTLSRHYGEVNRRILGIDEIKDRIEKGMRNYVHKDYEVRRKIKVVHEV